MDSRGRAYHNIMERLWWAVKYEDIYLHDYQDIPECKRGLEKYFGFYNTERRHQSTGIQDAFGKHTTLSYLKILD